eukprot:1143104-Pelagomonas_calceolata.AAC.6
MRTHTHIHTQTDWSLSSVRLQVLSSDSDSDSSMSSLSNEPITLPMASLEGRPGIQGRLWGSYLPIVALDQDQLDQGMAPPGISRPGSAGPGHGTPWDLETRACVHVSQTACAAMQPGWVAASKKGVAGNCHLRQSQYGIRSKTEGAPSVLPQRWATPILL